MFGCSCSWKGLNSLSVAMCSSISHVLMHFPSGYYAKCSCAHVLTHSSLLMCFRFSASHALQSLVFIRIVFLQSRMVPNSLYVRNWLAVRSQFVLTTAMAAALAMGPDYQRKNVYKLFIKGVHADMEGHGLEAIVQTMGYQPTKGFVSRG